MTWWGKLVGGAFGFMLGGPLGALFGAAVGHQFDKGLERAGLEFMGGAGEQERVQAAFFTALFSVMGALAKADGRVSEDEIAMARSIMQQMALDEAQKRVAIDLFNAGKQPDFDLDAVVTQFRQESGRRTNLQRMFLEILLHAAWADGVLHPDEQRLLQRVADGLGFPPAAFARLEAMVRAQRAFFGGGYEQPGGYGAEAPPRADRLREAYAILGVDESATDAEIKKAYRRLMNQHHPDKLVARGLPDEMIKLATEKTQEIKAAYELIRKARAG